MTGAPEDVSRHDDALLLLAAVDVLAELVAARLRSREATGDPSIIARGVADALARRAVANPVALSGEGRERPARPAATARPKRCAPRMPPVIEKRVEVSPENRERARQALLRRGIAVPTKETCP